ncbi:MAG: MSHA biogenesis protein MshA [Gammaproteobacteria bacterium]|jgi:MSHA pilin protein MshA|nr:MAG: MSHA biogenesis protein MshA [Gammaproteobacteria bacterium]PHR80116.1 MAG: MSHA biogenesis protein MshA [Colwellia sp.]
MNSKGFTLIELVVVIVILGILAVTAVPKYINLQADARTATLHAIKGSLEGAAALVHGKSLVKGNHNETFGPSNLTNSVNIGDSIRGGELFVVYGYPIGVYQEFERLVNIDNQYKYAKIGTTTSTFAIYFEEDKTPTTINENCMVFYIHPLGINKKPTFQVNDCI